MNETISAPILLTVFNRPRETGKLLDCLKQSRPSKILVASDGPREGHQEDLLLCAEVQRVIAEKITWPADITTNFSPVNLGLRKRMASAITWALDHNDRVIVLEDDCLPDPSFFQFCNELLDRYKDNPRVGVITGDNFQSYGFSCDTSYYFSRYPHCWGWATWRRAWDTYSDSMSDWPAVRNTDWLRNIFPSRLEELYWRQIFDNTYAAKIQSWAYRWTYALWKHDLLTITPDRNLVTNIGTGLAATNTKTAASCKHFLKSQQMSFPMVHPTVIVRNRKADDYAQKAHFGLAKDCSLVGRFNRLLRKACRLCNKSQNL